MIGIRAILYGVGVGGFFLAGSANLASGRVEDGLQWFAIATLSGAIIALAIGDIKIYKL